MNLKQRILNNYRENIINNFKSKHPEVYDWFQGDDFITPMSQGKNISIRWTMAEYFHMEAKPNRNLPAWDSNGEVNIHEVCLYLDAEGFDKEIIYNDGGNGFNTLAISLK